MIWVGKGLLRAKGGKLIANGEEIPKGALAPERISLFIEEGKIDPGKASKKDIEAAKKAAAEKAEAEKKAAEEKAAAEKAAGPKK